METTVQTDPTHLHGRAFSLRVRLLLLGLLTLIPAFGFVLYSTLEQRRDAEDRAREDALRLLQLAALQQKQMVNGARRQLLTLAQLPIVRDRSLAGPCNRTFARLREQHRHYNNFGVADLRGQIHCSGAPLKTPVNIADRDYFRAAVATRDFSISDYQIGRVVNKSVVAFGQPVLDDAGAVQGVAFVAIDLMAWFRDMAAGASLPPGASLSLVNDRGTILARHPDPEQWIGKTLPDRPLLAAIATGPQTGRIEDLGIDGVRRLYVFTPVHASPAGRVYLIAGIPSAELYTDANQAFLGGLAGILLVATLVGAAAWFGGSRLILSPVRALTEAARKLGAGDLGARTRLPHTADELGQLAHSFDAMAATLEQRVEQLHIAQDKLRQMNEGLERRVAERTVELEAANKELEAFSYSVSHDLRAPLRSIDGFSQALAEDYPDKLDDQGKNYVQRVRAATQRMGHLIDDLLQLSRVARADMKRETVDLSTLVMSAVEELREAQPGHTVEVVLQPGLTAEGDPKLLRVLLTNLLNNAWKFTGKIERPCVEFGATRENGKPVYYVRDNGAGFDMQYAHKLFGAFQRLHAMNEFPGTGVGLAIVQRIARRHGGEVRAEGRPGEGATFYFTLQPHDDGDKP